ncbi:hypothetical protein [Staphylothermus hellenicus]|uniref:Uncharacterized protein n=1 Tax=Staphylothermus hellenicus (strain DSM 12710 / JCM 10830 / BK20S6-10-b1 / P8) TaxID=591019 RepID=D7D9P8_STAHD|nr:hypothetical protein [Staphylothermus hellenicus]ADI32494.1 hypothetical protein Shell_1405 [Staphylothermus hellenicus DSM 12710]
MIPYSLYILSTRIIDPLYGYEKILCILLLVILIIISIFEMKRIIRIVVSIISAVTIVFHYYLLYLLSKFEIIKIQLFLVQEITSNGAAVTIDFGQIMLILIIYLWRREIARITKYIVRTLITFIAR